MKLAIIHGKAKETAPLTLNQRLYGRKLRFSLYSDNVSSRLGEKQMKRVLEAVSSGNGKLALTAIGIADELGDNSQKAGIFYAVIHKQFFMDDRGSDKIVSEVLKRLLEAPADPAYDGCRSMAVVYAISINRDIPSIDVMNIAKAIEGEKSFSSVLKAGCASGVYDYRYKFLELLNDSVISGKINDQKAIAHICYCAMSTNSIENWDKATFSRVASRVRKIAAHLVDEHAGWLNKMADEGRQLSAYDIDFSP